MSLALLRRRLAELHALELRPHVAILEVAQPGDRNGEATLLGDDLDLQLLRLIGKLVLAALHLAQQVASVGAKEVNLVGVEALLGRGLGDQGSGKQVGDAETFRRFAEARVIVEPTRGGIDDEVVDTLLLVRLVGLVADDQQPKVPR